jgi:hypothetical protein
LKKTGGLRRSAQGAREKHRDRSVFLILGNHRAIASDLAAAPSRSQIEDGQKTWARRRGYQDTISPQVAPW